MIALLSEIMSLAFNTASNQLAAANHKGVIQLYAVGSLMKLTNIWSILLGDEIPKVVTFGQMAMRN